jgi:1,4-alpha-glucan branching enzyme
MKQVEPFSLLTEFDIYLFKGGQHHRLYQKMGSHPIEHQKVQGTYFSVWAPNAASVEVIGEFNYWSGQDHQLFPRWDESGIWEGFIPHIGKGTLYKYKIKTKAGDYLEKGDPFALFWEIPPKTASIVWDLQYKWNDQQWMKNRNPTGPMSVYEVHIGSWKKKNGNLESLSYLELAEQLTAYVVEMGFTHVEFMPVMEHPFFPSWGYQVTGYFAPSSRYGTPEDFMALIDALHQAGIGVLLDWVPSHFPTDAFGLAQFDGTHLYEHADEKKGFHPDWKSAIFNYGRKEVSNFLISNALFWLDLYHADGLRVDAVASMLYLDYSREDGQWIPNMYGGNENLEAIDFLKRFNESVYKEYPNTITIAEESTAWSGVSRPTYAGGLGFGQKWMMGWMHDTLNYFKKDPIHRSYHHNEISFSLVYGFTENFMLPLSHDEVVHGKGALIDRMPGDEWQRFANLRLLFGYMFTHPGTKLIFMGGEFGQTSEWSITAGLDWHLLDFTPHQGIQHWIKTLNELYKLQPAIYEKQFDPEGFEWISLDDHTNCVLTYLRKNNKGDELLLVALNFTPVPRYGYKIGVPMAGNWEKLINSDEIPFGGSGHFDFTNAKTHDSGWNGKPHHLEITLPPLGICILKYQP